eukprot:GHVQ01001734.1.p1 GENE.GHVQ01001734.1~~GHVQ01001734.1.p1  ORF type:complete len:135 (+),score=8.89 GHVQ01001734.1:484-888(+)
MTRICNSTVYDSYTFEPSFMNLSCVCVYACSSTHVHVCMKYIFLFQYFHRHIDMCILGFFVFAASHMYSAGRHQGAVVVLEMSSYKHTHTRRNRDTDIPTNTRRNTRTMTHPHAHTGLHHYMTLLWFYAVTRIW